MLVAGCWQPARPRTLGGTHPTFLFLSRSHQVLTLTLCYRHPCNSHAIAGQCFLQSPQLARTPPLDTSLVLPNRPGRFGIVLLCVPKMLLPSNWLVACEAGLCFVLETLTNPSPAVCERWRRKEEILPLVTLNAHGQSRYAAPAYDINYLPTPAPPILQTHRLAQIGDVSDGG